MNKLRSRIYWEVDLPPTYKCTDCGEECTVSEETFSYAGTHCTHGKSGVHHTGEYSSDCCGAEYEEVDY
jgi:hypothetical protein